MDPKSVIARLRDIVGSDHVLASEEAVARYSKCTIPWDKRCTAIVFPGSREEVCAIVKVANECTLPIWPFSRGHNWGYGTTMAVREGAIILILERLNRIIEVNEDLAYAVIEPGVSQKQLNDYLKENRIKLWMDCTDSTPDGSVVGNAMERGVGYTPYGDHFGAVCGMEVVLPTGEIVRTGGGPDNCRSWHTFKWGVGPYLEGIFTQSNFGIVTKAGIWLMPEPEAFTCFVYEVPEAGDFPAALDSIRRLALHRTISNVHCFNDFLLMTTIMQYPYELREGRTLLSAETRASLKQRYGLSSWTMIGGVYGTRAQVRAHRAFIKRELSPHGRLQFLDDRRIALANWLITKLRETQARPMVNAVLRLIKNIMISPPPIETISAIPKVYPILKGIPGEFIVSSAYFKRRSGRVDVGVDPARDGCGLIWFAPVVPLTGRHVTEVSEACERVAEQYGFEYPLSVIMQNPRSMLLCMPIFYDREDPDETARALALYHALADLTISMGYQQYRTSVGYMERIFRSAPEFQRLVDSLKSAVDPNHILAPGRYGAGMTGRPGL